MNIRTSVEGRRGCGYRKEGGTYLVSGGEGRYCGALPVPLDVCPTCHHGIKPARGWTWIDLRAIRGDKPCIQTVGPDYCNGCPFFHIGKVGLLWVGEKFYANPAEFTQEARKMGISRRIAQIPRDFKIGETWVALAHRLAIPETLVEMFNAPEEEKTDEPKGKPGIFHLFKPTAIEYIVKPDDSEEKLEAMEKRGITLVKVVRDTDQQEAA